MNTDAAVDAWFDALDHPLKPTMLRVREILLGADPDMREMVQYGAIQFVLVSGMCTFVQVKDRRQVSLMFNAAGRLKGEFPHLEGKAVKYMRFHDVEEAVARTDELRAITAAWRAHKGTRRSLPRGPRDAQPAS